MAPYTSPTLDLPTAPAARKWSVVLWLMIVLLGGSGSSITWGGTLLLVFALGHSVLILIAETSMGAARQLIENKKATRVLDLLHRGAGMAIILVGVYFAYRGLKS